MRELASATAAGFSERGFEELARVDAGIGGGRQQHGRRVVERGHEHGFGLRGEALRQCSQFFEASALQAARVAAQAVGVGKRGGIELAALKNRQLAFQLAAGLVRGAGGFELRCGTAGRSSNDSGEELRSIGERLEVGARAADSAAAADKLDASGLANLSPACGSGWARSRRWSARGCLRRRCDPGPRCRRCAACLRDRRACAGRWRRPRLQTRPTAGGSRIPRHWRGARLRRTMRGSTEPPSRSMVAAVRAQVEAHRVQAEELFKNGRQKMLAGVLLHVVEAAFPIDGAVGVSGCHGRAQAMSDALAFVDDIDHRPARNRAGIGRLAARSGVERGVVEIGGEAVSGHLHHLRTKRTQAPVAQLDRASGYEPEGQVFESPRAHQRSNVLEYGGAIRGFRHDRKVEAALGTRLGERLLLTVQLVNHILYERAARADADEARVLQLEVGDDVLHDGAASNRPLLGLLVVSRSCASP
jgi:hypothetical protein